MTQPSLSVLYSDHLRTLTARADQALQRSGNAASGVRMMWMSQCSTHQPLGASGTTCQ